MALFLYFISMLLIFSSTQVRYSAEGRSVLKLAEVAKEEEGEGNKGMVMVSSSMIGSRPPRCERRCIACGHCEAIQVPVVPPQFRINGGVMHSFINSMNARGGYDNTNYKPMNWKCKCGNRILNP